MSIISSTTDIGRGSKEQNKMIPLNRKCHKGVNNSGPPPPPQKKIVIYPI